MQPVSMDSQKDTWGKEKYTDGVERNATLVADAWISSTSALIVGAEYQY
jgi:hypothetical protein